ncbi:MAG: YchJ family protein [Chromatiaceae bacterium]
MRSRKPPLDACPCGAPHAYADCCGRYLDAGQLPPTAEALMRSRYMAYVRKRSDYVLRTWHPSTRPAQLDLETESVPWLGLKVIRAAAGGPDDTQGTVEFVARYKIAGRAYRLREISRFTREDGQWLYLDAQD